MEVIYYKPGLQNCGFKTAVALGMFDGVHLGHKAVINKAIDYAKNNLIKSAVITLANHPRELTQGKSPKLITNLEERLILFESLGIDLVLVLNFDANLMNTSALEYLDNFLYKQLNAEFISTGYDHHFGKNREGNLSTLETWCLSKKISLNIEEALNINNEIISSSKIRELIKEGKIKDANLFLGHDFFIVSKVIHGDKRGSQIGFPTANLTSPESVVIPAAGVYSGDCIVEDEKKIHRCAINIGHRPSFADDSDLTIEVHIIDFNENIYGKDLQVRFKDRIRDEKKFNSPEQLIEQIKQDLEFC